MKEEKNTTLVPVETDEQELILMENGSDDTSSEILFEDTTKRSENVKHFRMKNGHYMAAVYDKPIHTFDKVTGKFVDIAHRFEEKEECFEAETDRFKARFPKKEGKRKFVTVEKDGRSVSWRYIPATNSHKKHAVAAIHQHERASLMELPRFPQLKYEKTEGQIDLEYGITEQGVKENIVLAKRPKHSTFRFELKLDGLKAVLAEDKKSILLFAEDMETTEPEFIIPPINMTDAAGVYSEAARYELVQGENGTVMEIVIDPEWLLAKERLYPVTVDPQVMLEHVHDYDAYDFIGITSKGDKESNLGVRRVGHEADGTENRVYAYFPLPFLPDGYKITNAALVLHQYGYSGEGEYEFFKITESWDAGTLSWSNQPSISTTVSAKVKGQYRSVSDEIELDVTSDVSHWYRYNGRGYYGYAIKPSDCNCTCTCACNCQCNKENYIDFYSNAKSNGYSPTIRVKYTLVDEFADHQKYESFSVGRAGNGTVNLFTGKLAFTHSDIVASGGKLPLTLSHVYRSDYADLDYTESTYGKGWIISAAQTLTLDDSAEVYAIYRDAQGRKHYFTDERFVNDTDVVYDDSTGLGLTYDGEHTVTDEKGNSLIFTDGKLTEIIDVSGKSMSMTYNTNGLLTQIEDGIGRIAKLNYDANNHLISIKDMKDRYTYFSYNSNNQLTQIKYPDSTTTVFTYESTRLARIADNTGIYYDIGYDTSSSRRVISVTRKGTKTVARGNVSNTAAVNGGGIAIIYRSNSTVVEDQITHIRSVYRFDDCGRVECSYEDLTENATLEKGEITVTDLREYEVVLNRKTASGTKGRYASMKAGISGTADMHPNYLTNGVFSDNTTGWSVTGSGSIVMNGFLGKYNAWKFKGTTTQRLQQSVTIDACNMCGNVLIASAWVKSETPTSMKLYATLTYEDGTKLSKDSTFDNGCEGWQYVAIPLEIPIGKSPASALVKVDCSGSGTCYVTNVRLTSTRGVYTQINYGLTSKETIWGVSQQYNHSVYNTNGLQSTLTYVNDQSDAVKTITRDEENNPFYSYAIYDDKHRSIKTMDYRGLVTEYTYDSFDNVKTQKTYHKDNPDAYFYSKADYSTTTGRMVRAYDSRSNDISTGYTYDTKADLLKKRVDPNGQIFEYGHHTQNDRQTYVTALDADCCCDITNGFAYDANYLTQVSHNGFNFSFEYDQLGRSSKIKAGDNELVNMTYTMGEESTVTTNYANGYTSVVTANSLGNPIKKVIHLTNNTPDEDDLVSTATYDEAGNVKCLLDNTRDSWYTYTYNKNGNLTKVTETNSSGSSVVGYQSYTYDAGLRPLTRYDSRAGQTYEMVYEKFAGHPYPDNAMRGVKLNGKYSDLIERDNLRRTTARKLTLASADSPMMTDTYGYLSNGNRQTTFVETLTHNVNGATASYTYTYDNVGNIETVKKGSTTLVKYTYDGLNRLIQEDNYEFGKRYAYTYDHGGNITSKKEYTLSSTGAVTGDATTYSYTYNSTWKDKLISFNGQTISYDGLGNPTTYRDHTLTWTRVRRLARYGTNTFEYNASGIRIKKNSTTYTLDGNKILRETDGTKTLTYYYGNSGVIGFNYNGTNYFYEKNLQGDVIAIYNASGTKVASYVYDAWGKNLSITNHTSANIGTINPFRYRSYYYDVETGLYYLQTRYYDPEVGRFINSDSLEYLGDGAELSNYNLFAYCGNNPVMGYDPYGSVNWWGVVAGVALIAIGVVVIAASNGAATPVGATLIAEAGSLIMATGMIATECAIKEEAMVIDVSTSGSSDKTKVGISLVIDFENSTLDLYSHRGLTESTGGHPFTYSVGYVDNYETIGDYGDMFVNAGGSIGWLGLDYCRSPNMDSDAVQAISLTFGFGNSPLAGDYNAYTGWDDYKSVWSWKWD